MDEIPCVFCGEPAHVGSYCSDCWRAGRQRPDAKREPAKGVTTMPADERPKPGELRRGSAGSDASEREPSFIPSSTGRAGASGDFEPLLRFAREHPGLVLIGLIVLGPKLWAWLVSVGSGSAAASSAVPVADYEPVPMIARLVTAIAVTVLSGGVGYVLLRLAPSPTPLPQLPPFPLRTSEQSRRKAEYDNRKAIEALPFLVGPLIGGGVCVFSHALFLGYAGWTWAALVGLIVLGLATALVGAALGDAAQRKDSERRSCPAESDDYGDKTTAREDKVAWSRKVQRGSISLKRLRHRTSLYLVSCGYWLSNLVTTLIARVVIEIEGRASWMRTQRDGWTDWLTSGKLTQASEVMDQASANVQFLFGLLLLWDWLVLFVTCVLAAWSLYWLFHDARVRVTDGEPKGIFLREVRWVILVNLVAWVGLRVAFGI